MLGGVEMFGRVLAQRLIAATDMAAAAAHAQVKPSAAGLQALGATARAGRDDLDGAGVFTFVHDGFSVWLWAEATKPSTRRPSVATTARTQKEAAPTGEGGSN
jgi:hypothetical protein